MPETTEILQLIENGENASAGFKTEDVHTAYLAKEFVAFSNFKH